MSFIVRARLGKFVDASADFDAQMQESKQGTMMIETVFCGLCYIILKLGELYRIC